MLSLQQKIVAEDKAVEMRTNDLMLDWERSKPVEGKIRPDEALGQLQQFESKFARLKEERDNVTKAKEALELQDPGQPFQTHLFVAVVVSDVDFHTVLNKYYPTQSLENIKLLTLVMSTPPESETIFY